MLDFHFSSTSIFAAAVLVLAGYLNAQSAFSNPHQYEFTQDLPGRECNISGRPCRCVLPPDGSSNTTDPPFELFDLLSKGSEFLKNYSDVNEAILAVGNTGAGKTTAIQIVAGNMSKLYVVADSANKLFIVDEEDRIGQPLSTKSKTLFPELFVKPDEQPLPFYDFPGFSDSRGSVEDIAANFFINEVVKKVSNVKIVFLVIHDSVSGNDKLDFGLLANHAARFLKEIHNFTSSFGLLVNKVNNFDDFGDFAEDRFIINGISDWLIAYNNTLREELENAKDDTVIDLIGRKIIFVSTLLTQDIYGNYSRIAIVRKPRACGVLSEIDIYAKIKENIETMYSSLEFTRIHMKTDEMFGFTLKSETIEAIRENYITGINSGISQAVSSVVSDLRLWQERSLKDAGLNLSFTAVEQRKRRDSMEVFKQKLINMTAERSQPLDFTQAMDELWSGFGYRLSSRFQDYMFWQQEYLNFFDKATDSRLDRNVADWALPLHQFDLNFPKYVIWFDFCLELEKKVYDPKFHTNKPELPEGDNNLNWLEFLNNTNIIKVDNEIRQAADFVGAEAYSIVSNILSQVYSIPTIQCISNPTKKLLVSNNWVVVSDALANLDQICSNATNLELYASHSIIVDTDINLIGKDLVLIAPSVVSAQYNFSHVTLQGKPGPSRSPGTAAKGSDGTANHQPQNGQHGCAGYPGDQSGTFFILTSNVEGNFSIHTIGGRGGQGQNGGDGGKGFNARKAICWRAGGHWDKPDYCFYQPEFRAVVCENYGIYAEGGANGGNGGEGGEGGVPLNGTFLVTSPGITTSQVRISTAHGAIGEAGSGGKGGLGGSAGLGYRIIVTYCEETDPSDDRHGSPGSNGSPGASSSCFVDPVQPVRRIQKWQSLLQYRSILHESKVLRLKTFLQSFDENPSVLPFFNLQALAEECLFLENLPKNEELFPNLYFLYNSLVDRLVYFSNKYFESSTLEHQKVIKTLLTSSFGSLRRFRYKNDINMVIDVSGYFDVVESQVKSLLLLENRNQINATIFAEKVKYQQSLNLKVKDANSYIQNIVIPSFDEGVIEIEAKLDQFEAQIVNLIEDTLLSLEDAKKKLTDMERQQRLYRALKLFGLLSKLASKYFPRFRTIEGLIEKLKSKYEDSEDNISRLQELIEEIENNLKDLEEKQGEFEGTFVPLVNDIYDYLENVTRSLQEGGEIHAPMLGFNKWQVIQKLKDCKASLEDFADDALNSRYLVHSFDRMQDTMVFMIDLYEMIDHYLETKSLAEYIAAMQSAHLGNVNVTDPVLAHTVANFDLKMKQNLVEFEIAKAFKAFRQWVFPFAKFYSPPSNGSKLYSNELERMAYLKIQLENYKNQIVGCQDTFIILMDFSSTLKSSKPFFVWENNNWYDEISAVLEGKPVSLFADIRQPRLIGWDAIKFRMVEVNFTLHSATPELQAEFDDLIEYFGITMTHSGISYYRFQSNFFVMTGSNQTLVYNFERDKDGNRLGTNMVYDKFKQGDYLLSPYTIWTIQLKQVVPTKASSSALVDFEDLKKFLPYINVELVGRGTYVNSEEAIKAANGDLQLDQYYEREDRMQMGHDFALNISSTT